MSGLPFEITNGGPLYVQLGALHCNWPSAYSRMVQLGDGIHQRSSVRGASGAGRSRAPYGPHHPPATFGDPQEDHRGREADKHGYHRRIEA